MLVFFVDIHQLKVFASVFKNRSFSRASEELHLTQPTISDHVKTLEEELECKLFDRLGRTIIPTKEAEVLYSHAVEIIEKINVTKDMLGRLKKEITGELVVGASTIPGTYLMPSLIKKDVLTLRDLVKFPMVLREEGSGTRKELEKILEGEGITLEDIKIAGIFGSTDAIKQAVKAGLGFSVLSKLSVAAELKYRLLKEIKLP